MAMTPEELLALQEELRKKKEAEALGGTVPPVATAPVPSEADPLDLIIARKQKPDPLAEYDKRIQEATDAPPNIGQMIGAGFAGFGQSLAGQGDYLDKTLKGIEAGRQRNITGATLAKTQFEESGERDPNSNLSREFQLTAAEMTGRKPEDLADMSAYDIKKILPTLESRYKIKERSEERKSEDRYRQEMIRATRDKAEAAATAKANAPTKGQVAVDTTFGKDYADYVAGGGFSTGKTQIDQLRKSLPQFDKIQASGPFVSMLPEGAQKRLFPKAADLRRDVEDVVQGSLRQILGAQFTEKEGERILARAFDPTLPEEINKGRVEKLLNKLELGLKAKDEAVKYFEENGTLAGFKGRVYGAGQLASEFESETNGAQGQTAPAASAGPHGNRVKQNGKIYVWNGTEYVEEK